MVRSIHVYTVYQVATQLSSRGWVDPIPDPILPEKFLGYSQELNLGFDLTYSAQ